MDVFSLCLSPILLPLSSISSIGSWSAKVDLNRLKKCFKQIKWKVNQGLKILKLREDKSTIFDAIESEDWGSMLLVTKYITKINES